MKNSWSALLALLCLGTFVVNNWASNPVEDPETFHLLPAAVHGKEFLVGSVHHGWVLNNEQGCLGVVDRALREKEGKCIALDVGMNDGFYTQFAASYGCQVYSFELQASCITLARNATAANNFTHLVSIFRSPVSNRHGVPVRIPFGDDIQLKRCDGGFSITGKDPNLRAHRQFSVKGHHTLHAIALDNFLPLGTTVDLLKLDVEGHDVEVLMGAMKLFKNQRIKRAVVEVTWGGWGVPFEEGVEVYKKIFDAGYRFRCVTVPYMRGQNLVATVLNKEFDYEAFKGIAHDTKCIDWEIFLS